MGSRRHLSKHRHTTLVIHFSETSHFFVETAFEADSQICRTVPGLVKQGTVRFPAGKLHSFSHLYRHFTGSSHYYPVGLSPHPANEAAGPSRDSVLIQQLSAELNRIIGSCLDHTARLSSFSIRYCCHFLTFPSISDCPDKTETLQTPLLAPLWTSKQALCHAFISEREIHSAQTYIRRSILV